MWTDELANANDGDTVTIPAGMYDVDPIVISGKSVTLVGEGMDNTRLRLRAPGHLLTVTGGEITILDLCLDGNKARFKQLPYAVLECAAGCGVTLARVCLCNGKEFGLDARGCIAVSLTDCITANCGDGGNVGAGLYFREKCGPVVIVNCSDYGSGLTAGLEGASLQTADCVSLHVDGYYSQDASKYAIKLQSPGAELKNITIVRNGGQAAISLQADNCILDGAQIRDGIGSGIDVARFAINGANRGIVLKNITIERQSWNGIYIVNQYSEIDMTGVSIENATVYRCQYGARIRGNISGVTISDACLMDNSDRGFWSQGDVVGVPENVFVIRAKAFGFDITPSDGFAIIEGSGELVGCVATGNRININGNGYSIRAA